jgi:archaellum component FlaF (FlaF/FlaG flagellin family)
LAIALVNSSGNQYQVGSNVTDASSGALAATAANLAYNGATWDRQRNNVDVTLLASASRTTTQTSADITTYNAAGIHVVLDMTVVGTGSVTVSINGKDSVSGKFYTILAGAAVTTNSTNVYKIFPGATVTANVSANDHLPRVIQIVVTANNANAATYSVGYCLLA